MLWEREWTDASVSNWAFKSYQIIDNPKKMVSVAFSGSSGCCFSYNFRVETWFIDKMGNVYIYIYIYIHVCAWSDSLLGWIATKVILTGVPPVKNRMPPQQKKETRKDLNRWLTFCHSPNHSIYIYKYTQALLLTSIGLPFKHLQNSRPPQRFLFCLSGAFFWTGMDGME